MKASGAVSYFGVTANQPVNMTDTNPDSTTMHISDLAIFNDVRKLSHWTKPCQNNGSRGIVEITEAYQENSYNFQLVK
jgi:hypothetical protein